MGKRRAQNQRFNSVMRKKGKFQNSNKQVNHEEEEIDEEIVEDYLSNVDVDVEKMWLNKKNKKLADDEEKDGEDDDHEENLNGISVQEEEKVKVEEPKSFVDLYVRRKDVVWRVKDMFAQIGHSVMANPQESLKQLNRVLAMLDVGNTDPEYGVAFFTIQKLAFQSLCVVFADIVPNYRVSERNPAQMSESNKHPLQQKTLKLVQHEHSLLLYYNNYLQRIERIIKCSIGTKSNFYKTMLTTNEARMRLAAVACQCLCSLLAHHYNFNSRSKVITLICEVMCSKKHATPAMRAECSEALINLFKQDRLGEVSLETVQILSKLISQNDFRISPLAFRAFQFLDLSVLATESTDQSVGKPKGGKIERSKLSRTERKRNKKMKQLENQLLETEAVESREKQYRWRVETHKQLFAIYFHYLKRCQEVVTANSANDESYVQVHFRPLFALVLSGVLKFSLYLNDSIIYELIDLLRKLISDAKFQSSWLTSTERLLTLQTIFHILSFSKNLLSIDFHSFYQNLFQFCSTPEVYRDSMQPLLACLREMILKRIREVSLTRLVSFADRLVLLAGHLSPPEALATLTIVRLMFQANPIIFDRLFNMDEIERPTRASQTKDLCMDPDATVGNELNSIYNFNLLIESYHDPYVRFLAQTILHHFKSVAKGGAVAMFGSNAKVKNLNLDLCHLLTSVQDPKIVYRHFHQCKSLHRIWT